MEAEVAWRMGGRRVGGGGWPNDDGGDPTCGGRRIDGKRRAGRRCRLHLADVGDVFSVRRSVADLDFAGSPRSEDGFVVDGREKTVLPVVWMCEEKRRRRRGGRRRWQRQFRLSRMIRLGAKIAETLSEWARRTIWWRCSGVFILDGLDGDVVGLIVVGVIHL